MASPRPRQPRLARVLAPIGLADGFVEETLRYWYLRLRGERTDAVRVAIDLFGRAYPRATFIQIGSNDGIALDPLRSEVVRRRWRGAMVEPVPFVFDRLAARYGNNPRLTLVNAAVAEHDGVLPFYSLAESDPGEEIWGWYHALGSFRRDVVLASKDRIPDIEDRIVELNVPTMTLASVCRRADIVDLDLLQMDTEGYDYEIVRNIPFEQHRPRLIVYEHVNLSDDDKRACVQLLQGQGYRTIDSDMDTAALDFTRLDRRDQSLERHFAKHA